jgi:uncharacterized protein with NRDE domain
MCLLAFAHRLAGYELVFAGNRDELHRRPTAKASFWDDDPRVFGGRDLVKGGTWLALARSGRLATLTNVRDGAVPPAPRSRGLLCGDFVRGEAPAEAYARAAIDEREAYGGFNLVLREPGRVVYASGGQASAPRVLDPGIYGLSNASLDVPWPKVVRAKDALRAALTLPEPAMVAALFAMLRETEDDPHASPFLRSPVYGTRASTVIVWRTSGSVVFEERSFDDAAVATGAVREEFTVEA